MTTVAAVGQRIAEEREARGLTRAELATRVGFTEKALQRIELGGSTSTERLLEIARAMHVEAATFFTRPSTPKRSPGRPKRHEP